MKKVGICGHFGKNKTFLDGQTVKTKIITKELQKQFGNDEILIVDTYGGIKNLFRQIIRIFFIIKNCKNVIILPAHNGLRVFVPVLVFLNKFFKRGLHYIVIGGWLPEFVSKRKWLSRCLKKFDYIYVETSTMKESLKKKDFNNVVILPNCKNIKILKEEELIYNFTKPYKLCTFSRVMKEKGIEDAVKAVKGVNEKYGEIIYRLDIYGQIDNEYKIYFEKLCSNFPEYIRYKGMIPYEQSTEVLKNYYALLFPTYYEGEGFAGTLIDALASGIPVVASDWRYNSEIVEEDVTGFLFKTKNVKFLMDKLVEIYEKNIFVNNMKKECLKEANKYLPENVINVVLENLKN
ncbi:MAG: glycosyltransferase [Clostridium sp.]|nr:glycosyltransferase [Clostridium sp.]